MDKIAVVGDYDSIYGFAAVGLDTFPAEGEEVVNVMHKVTAGAYGIIYITEKAAGEVPGIIEHYKEKTTPAIILIPGADGNTGEGVNGVKKSVEQAVGSDILFSEND